MTKRQQLFISEISKTLCNLSNKIKINLINQFNIIQSHNRQNSTLRHCQ